MHVRSLLFRTPVFTLCLALLTGPVHADDNKPSRYTSRSASQNSPGKSARWGDRLNSMKSQSSRSSSSSYRQPSRSSSSSSRSSGSTYSRGNTRSSTPSSRSSSYSRGTTRSSTPNSGSSYSRSSRSSTPSASSRFSRGTSSSNSGSSYSRSRSTPTITPRSSAGSSPNRGRSTVTRPSSSGNDRSRFNSTTGRSGSSTSSINRSRSSVSRPNTSVSPNRGRTTITRPDSYANRSSRQSGFISRPSITTPSTNNRTGSTRQGVSGSRDRGRTVIGTDSRDDDQRNRGRPGLNRPGNRDYLNRGRPGGSYSGGRIDRDDGKDRDRDDDRDRSRYSRGGKYSGHGSIYNRYKDRHYGPHRHDYYYRRYRDPFYYTRFYGPYYYPYTSHSTIILHSAEPAYRHYTSGREFGSTSPGYAVLYEHAGFRGNSLEIHAGEGVLNLGDLKKDIFTSFNDRISSVKIYGNVTVVLYEHSDFGGDYVYLHGSVFDFGRDKYLRRFNDEVSSAEVLAGNVDEQTRLNYDNLPLTSSSSHLNEQPRVEMQASAAGYPAPAAPSVSTEEPVSTIPSTPSSGEVRVFLYDQPDYQGNQIVLTPGTYVADLAERGKGLSGNWDDAVKSIRIEGEGEVFLYTDAEFLGEGVTIRESIPDISAEVKLVTFAGTVSSVLVNTMPAPAK